MEIESIKSEKIEKKESNKGSGGLYAHLSPFFIWAKKSKKNKK